MTKIQTMHLYKKLSNKSYKRTLTDSDLQGKLWVAVEVKVSEH